MRPALFRGAWLANVPAAFTAATHMPRRFALSNATIFFTKIALVGARLYFDKIVFGVDGNDLATHVAAKLYGVKAALVWRKMCLRG